MTAPDARTAGKRIDALTERLDITQTGYFRDDPVTAWVIVANGETVRVDAPRDTYFVTRFSDGGANPVDAAEIEALTTTSLDDVLDLLASLS